jgi:cytochrome b
VLVWPWWLRALHWSLAISVMASFATHEGGGVWHERWGYLALAVAALRLLTGLLSSAAQTRLSGWLHSPAITWAYALAHARGHAPRHLGHNPLGGWMMALLLADVLACGFTGWLYTTDRFWGTAWLETLHGVLGDAFVPLVLLHVAGSLWASRMHHENLVAAMLHGRKRAAGPGDVA